MSNLEDLFDAIHVSIDLNTPNEIKQACELIMLAQSMSEDAKHIIKSLYEDGPLHDGDIVAPTTRNWLITKGVVVKIVVTGRDGFNACTNIGGSLYRLIKTMEGSSNE